MKNKINWILRLVPAVILLQTLYFKFTPAPAAVNLFTKIGLEPEGRIAVGILELITAILILIPKTTVYGAILGVGLMAGAIMYHLTSLGIEVDGDGGKVFYLALVVTFFCIVLVIRNRHQLPFFSKK